MTEKERLEEIKEKYFMYENYTGKVIMYHHVLEWLIEQAERVQELESELSKYETRINNLTFDLAVNRAQNQRYREALEFYADRGNYKPEHYDPNTHEYMSMVDCDEGATARQALEGEK